MIMDKQNLLSEDQAITVTANSTNIIDLGNDNAAVQALNEKGDLELFAQVTTAFAGGTSVALTVTASDSSTFSSETTIAATSAIGQATLVQGYQFSTGKLPRIDKQYIRATYTVVGTMSAGAVTAGLILDRQTNGV